MKKYMTKYACRFTNCQFSRTLSRTLTFQKNCDICFIKCPLKMMKNAFYFILKALFVLKIFKFLSRLFGHVGKTT